MMMCEADALQAQPKDHAGVRRGPIEKIQL